MSANTKVWHVMSSTVDIQWIPRYFQKTYPTLVTLTAPLKSRIMKRGISVPNGAPLIDPEA